MKILVTGTAGFIGFHVAKQLLKEEHEVVGLDAINTYYDIRLKHGRLKETGINANDIIYNKIIQSSNYPLYRFVQLNVEDREHLMLFFEKEKFDIVCHLAAQGGVRYSIENPNAYIDSNIVGFMNILENCRNFHISHLVYASSSSVYGMNNKIPFSEDDRVDNPVSIYAATKKANELMAYTYSHLYGMNTVGLRFFSVYGPWGRPDMAPMLFTKSIINQEPIKVFNEGNMLRDFTYIDDIVEGVAKVVNYTFPKKGRSEIYNIGCSTPINLLDFIRLLEENLNKKALLEMYPMQQGDVYQTFADTSKLEHDFLYKPSTALSIGIKEFVLWYLSEKNPLK